MTNEELFTDLKQFIEVTVSQQAAHLDNRVDGLEQRMNQLEQRLTSRMDTLDEKLDLVQGAIAETVHDHEHRLRRLEKRTA